MQGGAGGREGRAPVIQIPGGPVHVSAHEVVGEAGPVAELVLLHDLSFIERRSQDTRRYLIILIAGLGGAIALDHRDRRPAELARLGLRRARADARRGPDAADGVLAPELAPLAVDLRARLRDLEDEYRRALGPEGGGTPSACDRCCAPSCAATQVIVVSNREPYIHERGRRQHRRPAARRAAW